MTKPRRKRAPKKISTPVSAKEKRIIKTMTEKGATMRQIAAKIGRVPSVVWRWQHHD